MISLTSARCSRDRIGGPVRWPLDVPPRLGSPNRLVTTHLAGLSRLPRAERLALGLRALRLLSRRAAERLLHGLRALAGRSGRDAHEFLQASLDVPLAVVRPVRDPLHEIVDVGGRVKVRCADLSELVEDPVPHLAPV